MIRKTAVLLLAAAAAAVPGLAEEPTLDKVLAGHYEAIGGLEAWQGMESARVQGSMNMGQGMEAPFTMTFKRPKKVRLEFTVQGMTGIQAYDGETAWMVMPFMGKKDPEEMTADQKRIWAEQADLEGPLINYEEKGHTVELEGVEDVEGTAAYKVKVTLASGEVRYHYLEKDSFVTIKQTGKVKAQDQEVEMETTLSDYKLVDGLAFAHSIESKPKGAPQGQVITIKSVELNPGVEDGFFAMPPPAPKETEAPAG